MSRVEDKYAIDLDEDYIAGVIDYLSNPKLEITDREQGFGITDRRIQISVRQSEILCGIITQHLEKLDINYNVSHNRNGDLKHINVQGISNIEKLENWGRGRFLQISDRLKYLSQIGRKYEGENLAVQPRLFLKVYKSWVDLNPEWQFRSNIKYTLEYVESELDVGSVEGKEPVPDVQYPTELSTPYIAGLFDAQGNIRLNISKNNEYGVGYVMQPAMTIQIPNPRTFVEPHLKKYFSDTEISPSFNTDSQRIMVSLSNADGVEKILALVAPHSYYHVEACQLFYEQLVPAIKDGYHHNKEGFLDIVRAYESVVDRGPSTKYDVEYFENEWDIE